MQKDFITVTPDNGSGNATVATQASINTGEARSTSIAISASGMTRTIEINQERKPLNQVGDYSISLGYIGKSGTFTDLTNWEPYSFKQNPDGYQMIILGWNGSSFIEDLTGKQWDANGIYLKWDANQNLASIQMKDCYTGDISDGTNVLVSGNMGNNQFEDYTIDFNIYAPHISALLHMKLVMNGTKE